MGCETENAALHIRTRGTDTWLTPPELIHVLVPFDMDVCCPPVMPWRTATRMIHFPEENGLEIPWEGRVWCNPPYSKVDPWADRMVAHRNGLVLVGGKSIDAQWCQKMLRTCDGAFLFEGRLLFHFEDGKKSNGKWMPNLLFAFGEENYDALTRLKPAGFKGVAMLRDALI